MTTTTVPTVKLNNRVEMPILGFGVFQIDTSEATCAGERESTVATFTTAHTTPS